MAFSADLALVGFQSPATWLIGFGLLIGVATRESGLAAWAGRWVVARAVPERWHDDPLRTYAVLLVALCLGALAFALLVAGVVFALYRPARDSVVEIPATGPGAAGTGERRMALFLLAGTLFWTTDFLHGLHPVFGAILVVALVFLPSWGVIDFSAAGDPDCSILFFLGGVFAIGEGLSETGFADLAAEGLLGAIPTEGSLAIALAFVFGATILLNLLMEGLAVASVLTPVLVSYASAAGLPLTPVVMTEALALGTYFFPYQSAVLVAILAEDAVEAGDLIRVTVACSLATVLILLPVQFGVFSLLY